LLLPFFGDFAFFLKIFAEKCIKFFGFNKPKNGRKIEYPVQNFTPNLTNNNLGIKIDSNNKQYAKAGKKKKGS
jgi:hypothetical protein